MTETEIRLALAKAVKESVVIPMEDTIKKGINTVKTEIKKEAELKRTLKEKRN